MAGIYIHIPFCKQACHYCNFHFSTSLKLKNDFLICLLKEASLQQSYLEGETVETLYFGGGTPSLLSDTDIDTIIVGLKQHFSIDDVAEVTLEANPDDITSEKVFSWKKAGINRLSIGIQSFIDTDLNYMNRAHSALQAINAIKISQDNGFENISIDLIYGLPDLPDVDWEQNILKAISLNIPHLSCYALTVEPGTALQSMIEKKKVKNINDDDQARQFELLMKLLKRTGYEHYEISNFALPGKRSRHNSAYWQGKKYLGLGPSAHSYNGSSRQWNVANNSLYIESLKQDSIPFEKEELTKGQQLNEYIMTSLRTSEGLNIDHVVQQFNEKTGNELRKSSIIFLDQHLMREQENHLILTAKGKLFADGIACHLTRIL